jgi:hypothetical protein
LDLRTFLKPVEKLVLDEAPETALSLAEWMSRDIA